MHRGLGGIGRPRAQWPSVSVVQLPVHASWLNQVEVYFSVIQRKVLTPNEFEDLEELEAALLAFERYYETYAKPFEWRFTRRDLRKPLAKLAPKERFAERAAA